MNRTATLLPLLEELARTLNVEIRYAALGVQTAPQEVAMPIRSGSIVIRGKRVVMVDKNLPDDEKARVLGSALARLDLSAVYLQPLLRDYLTLFPLTTA